MLKNVKFCQTINQPKQNTFLLRMIQCATIYCSTEVLRTFVTTDTIS